MTRSLVLALALMLIGATRLAAEAPTIYIVTWRGCEDACRGFQDHFRERGIAARFVLRDAAQDVDRLPGFVDEARELGADLALAWGTSVAVALVGRLDDVDPGRHLTDVPVVFTIVADPLGAGLVASAEASGRANVTGTRNRIPEMVQIKAMRAYRPLRRVGLIYNTDELNARLKAEELRALAIEEGLELVELRIEPGADGKPSPEAIAPKVEEAAGEGVDFLYVASSSFLMAERDRLTAAALAAGLPLASAYEAMVVESQALLAVAARYYNVGRLAGFQAEQILLHGADPATMPIRGLDRFSYLVNMETARRLGLYPPLDVLRYAEIINGIPADSAPAAVPATAP